jgi:hypothetical protein
MIFCCCCGWLGKKVTTEHKKTVLEDIQPAELWNSSSVQDFKYQSCSTKHHHEEQWYYEFPIMYVGFIQEVQHEHLEQKPRRTLVLVPNACSKQT